MRVYTSIHVEFTDGYVSKWKIPQNGHSVIANMMINIIYIINQNNYTVGKMMIKRDLKNGHIISVIGEHDKHIIKT